MLRSNFQILTSEIGLHNYSSIPLEGKSRYKVANAIGHSNTFSIVAFTVDDAKPNVIIRRGATERRIMFELQWLSDIVISSASGTVYVNVAPVGEKKQYGKGTLEAAGGIGTAGILKNMFDLGSTLYGWYSPSKDEPEFEFSIGARETKSTKLKLQGEGTLGNLIKHLNVVGAFEPKVDVGKSIYNGLKNANESKQSVTGTFEGLSGAFNSLFG